MWFLAAQTKKSAEKGTVRKAMKENSEEASRIRLLIQTTRTGIYALVVLLTLLNHLLQDNFFNWSLMKTFYGLSLVGLFIHLVPLIRLNQYFHAKKWVFLSFVVDVILISALMTMSGLNPALFLFMYLVTIILSGLIFELRGALLMAALTSIGFTVSSWFGPEVKAMSYLFVLILNNIAFFAVAGISGYLSEQLNFFEEKIQAQNLSLRVVRKLNEMIIETMPLGLLTVNSLGEVIQSNPGAEKILKASELEGTRLGTLLPEFVGLENLPQMTESLLEEIPFEKDGETHLLRVQVLPQISDFEVPTFLVVMEDLTQIRQMEDSLRQNEKMAAIGGLAAGIAHEIRNPLAGISGSIELLSSQFTTEDDKKLGKIILREIDRLNRLISEFLDFAKPDKLPMDPVDLQSVLREVVDNAKASLPVDIQNRIQWNVHFDGSGVIRGHGDKLKQAFLNIVINAVQAMDKSSRAVLTVSLKNSDNKVIVHVKDTGLGMKPETQKRMFEPFHTTKAKGTGLGLAITHKILQTHNAHIFVESREGVGTEFVISFPLKSIENQRVAFENKVKEDHR